MRLAVVWLIPAVLLAEAPKLDEPYRSIANLANGAPAEFAADALLRLVESGKIKDKAALRELTEQAFQLSANAKFPVRMRGLPSSLVDSRTGYLSKSYELKLDTLSLQSRAVRDMLAIDTAKARELFNGVTKPQLERLSCDDGLVYDVADFYQTLGAIANSAFTAEERKKEENISFLVDYISQATSPAQMGPLAQIIKASNVTAAQREILWAKFNGVLANLQPDDRSFAASLKDINDQMTMETRVSFATYKDKSKGCVDDVHPAISQQDGTTVAEPGQAGLTPRIHKYWESASAHIILEGAKSLRFTPAGTYYTDAERASKEWQQQLTDFLSRLADWGPGQEKSEADYYHQKCVVYEALVELVPAGPERDEILNAYVHFTANSGLFSESPVEWFMHPHSMLERVRATPTGEPSKLLDAFQNSGNRVLALYAALEKTFVSSSIPPWVTSLQK